MLDIDTICNKDTWEEGPLKGKDSGRKWCTSPWRNFDIDLDSLNVPENLGIEAEVQQGSIENIYFIAEKQDEREWLQCPEKGLQINSRTQRRFCSIMASPNFRNEANSDYEVDMQQIRMRNPS
jgi:hypothetical protein